MISSQISFMISPWQGAGLQKHSKRLSLVKALSALIIMSLLLKILLIIYSLYLAIIMNKNSLIIENKTFACEEIIYLIKFIYKRLPNTIGSCNIPEIVSSNKHFIRFKNGCYILSYSPTQDSNATRGFYFNTIIVNDMQKFNMNSLHDVFEFIKLYKNNQQCILHSTEISIEILLKYKHFYKTVVDAVY